LFIRPSDERRSETAKGKDDRYQHTFIIELATHLAGDLSKGSQGVTGYGKGRGTYTTGRST
jgi:hypothetical protein